MDSYGKKVSPAGTPVQRLHFRLCPLDDLSMDTALQVIGSLARNNRFDYVVTPNIDHIQRLYRSGDKSELRAIYRSASLSLCDSRILEKILALTATPVTETIPGSSLTERIFRDLLTPDDRILLVGGDSTLIARLQKLYPALSLRHVNPSMGFIKKPEEVNRLVEEIAGHNADYLFLAVGSPRQELLARLLSRRLKRGVALCVGASLLFLAGSEQRAPVWVQRFCCEWAYRLATNPRRLAGRYLLNFCYLPAIGWSFIRRAGHFE